jgi:hypothetical protein
MDTHTDLVKPSLRPPKQPEADFQAAYARAVADVWPIDDAQAVPAGSKPTNPKDEIGSTKLPLHAVPDTAAIFMAMAFAEGQSKYGAYNWRVAGARVSIYISAARRHIAKWMAGEECDQRTGVHHLASAMACLAIILDARLVGKLTDDRPPSIGSLPGLIDDFEDVVKHLYNINSDHAPRHYTIEDEV